MIRIGTWNLQGAPSRRMASQLAFMAAEDCDIWLLTEVPLGFEMGCGHTSFSAAMGMSTKAFAAVWAKQRLTPLEPIHPAAAFAIVGDTRVCSCVLPWRAAAAPVWPDEGDLATITRTAIDHVGDRLAGGTGDLIWGGDWNCALQGRDYVGTSAGRTALRAVMTTLDLRAPTSDLPHREDGGLCSIDHIAVPNSWTVCARRRCVAANSGTRLSDHDAYIVEVTM